MIRLLLASHGKLAEGIYSSLKIIMGEQNNIETLCAYMEEEFNLKKEISDRLNDLSDGDKLIVVTDIFGGSVNNEFMNNLNRKNLYLISGLNLPLVMELINVSDENDIEEKIMEALENSKKSIQYCNLIMKLANIEEDSF